jgi:hypothetical protein
MEEARKHTMEAIHTLVELICGATSESVRLNAAEAVLSRGMGPSCSGVSGGWQFRQQKAERIEQ